MTTTTDKTSENDDFVVQKLIQEATAAAGPDAVVPMEIWAHLHPKLTPDVPFSVHQKCYSKVYDGVDDVRPSWIPTKACIEQTNIAKMMHKLGIDSYAEFYQYSIHPFTRNDFWMQSMQELDVVWETPPTTAFQGDATNYQYFPGGTLNVADSCFHKRQPHEPALVYAMESDPRNIQNMSFGTLNQLSNQIAHALSQKLSLQPGDAVAICMPMTPESIAIYLGIVKAACVVVSIADSFSAREIALRCHLARAKAIFTQDVIYRGAKFLPLYTRVLEADAILRNDNGEEKETKTQDECSLKIVVLPGMLHAGPYPKLPEMHRSDSGTWNDKDKDGNPVSLHDSVTLRQGLDCSWHDFLHFASDQFVSVKRNSMDACNILFSSGTTGAPKAIVWSHTTPIKCAIDGMYHQDIHCGDRVCWPTNIGWMMGPWLLYQMMNGATVGIFNGVTSTDAFCQFVQEAKINMVGVIPSLVKAWQAKKATQNVDWSAVRKFSSTGEASDAENYQWLASRVPGYAPIIEYCGGTEIGGSFLSSTLVQPNVPSMFSSPVLGSELVLLDSEQTPMSESRYCEGENVTMSGEIALVPPSLGLSTHLLNRNHYDTYYKDMPSGPNGEVLRRHGDEIQLVRNSTHCGHETSMPYFRALGRCDDTMNIGGIKVASVEIERVCNLVPGVVETAAIAVSHGGPCKLVIYAVVAKDSNHDVSDSVALKSAMQKSIKSNLNPLFGISDVVVTESLPRTASNKVMRRLLRDDYHKVTSAPAC